MVLMCLAVFSIVFFQSWHYVEAYLTRLFGSDPYSTKVGSIAGKTVTERQFREFRAELLSVGDSFYTWIIRLEPHMKKPEDIRQFRGLTLGRSAIWTMWQKWPSTKGDKPTHELVLTWMALYEEAVKYGFSVPTAEAESRIASLQGMGIPPELIYQASDQAGLQRPDFVEGLRKDMTMYAYTVWLQETLAMVAEPEMRLEFAKKDERIKVRLAVLRASDATADLPAPSDADLKAQFDKYKKFLLGDSPEGFGYRIPDKVQIEYLVAAPAAFEAEAAEKLKGKMDDMIKGYYNTYKDPNYLLQENRPAGAPEPTAAEKKYKPLEQVKPEITRKIIEEVSGRLAEERVHMAAVEIRSAATPPADLQMWVEEGKVRLMKLPGFLSAAELKKVEGLGKASRQSSSTGRLEYLPEYALKLDALVGKDKPEEPADKDKAVDPLEKDKPKAAKFALKEMSDAFTDTDGMAYAFRVTAVEPNHEPATLAEVRDKVSEDVKLIKAFEQVREKARALLTAAEAKGLEEAAKAEKIKTFESDYFTRELSYTVHGEKMSMPSILPEVGADRKLVDECFQMKADKDTDKDKDKKKLRLVTLTDKHMAVVVELLDEKAPRQALYDQEREQLIHTVAQKVALGPYERAIALKDVRARMEVVVEVQDEKGKGEGPGIPEQPIDSGDE
jgi:hypothetical protein